MEIVSYEGHQIWDTQLSTPGANCANFILPCLKRISGSYHKKQSRLNKCNNWQCFLCLHEIMKRNEFDSLTFHIARLHMIALYHELHTIWQLYLFIISILTKKYISPSDKMNYVLEIYSKYNMHIYKKLKMIIIRRAINVFSYSEVWKIKLAWRWISFYLSIKDNKWHPWDFLEGSSDSNTFLFISLVHFWRQIKIQKQIRCQIPTVIWSTK